MDLNDASRGLGFTARMAAEQENPDAWADAR